MTFKIEFDAMTIFLVACVAIIIFVGPDMELFTSGIEHFIPRNDAARGHEIQPGQAQSLVQANCNILSKEYAKLQALSNYTCIENDESNPRETNNNRIHCYNKVGQGAYMANNMRACRGSPTEGDAQQDGSDSYADVAYMLEGPHMMHYPFDRMNLAPYEPAADQQKN